MQCSTDGRETGVFEKSRLKKSGFHGKSVIKPSLVLKRGQNECIK